MRYLNINIYMWGGYEITFLWKSMKQDCFNAKVLISVHPCLMETIFARLERNSHESKCISRASMSPKYLKSFLQSLLSSFLSRRNKTFFSFLLYVFLSSKNCLTTVSSHCLFRSVLQANDNFDLLNDVFMRFFYFFSKYIFYSLLSLFFN